MEIGQRLKEARSNGGFTQEDVAEKIGVSRQTISNWETNKSYPDIMSVIGLSDLYSISLDALLKEDKNMIKHLDESTNTVKSYERLRKILPMLIFLTIWSVCMAMFWLGGEGDAMGYGLVVMWMVLPIAMGVTAYFIGKEEWASILKVVQGIVIAAMYMLAEYGTFSLANMLANNKVNPLEFSMFVVGGVIVAIGMGIGCLVRFFRNRKANK